MLTKDDLKAIREVVREEIEVEKEDLQGEIKLARVRIQSDVRGLDGRLKNVEILLRKIQKDLKTAVNFFDNEYIEIDQRVKNIEKHTHFPSIN